MTSEPEGYPERKRPVDPTEPREPERPKAYASFGRQEARPDATEDVPASNGQAMANYLARQDAMSRGMQFRAMQLAASNMIPPPPSATLPPRPGRVQGLHRWVDADPMVKRLRKRKATV